MSDLDEINKDILRLLGEDSRYQYTELKRQLKKKGHTLSREAVEYRVKRLIENGSIKKFAMITDPQKIGYQICIYFEIFLSDLGKRDEIGLWLASLPNSAYVHSATNKFDIGARVFFKDQQDMFKFIEVLEADPRVNEFSFDIIRKTYKVGPIAPP
jgi:Lrp/AsnC family transcriptional regulator for asnA, asnC and gidA